MKKSELFTQEMLEKFTCHPYAVAPIRGYLFENLKNNGSVIWFTETDFEAEHKYPEKVPCNA